ncbi:hypothetical protein MKX01_001921 [Papaver californicum]|nr:hypothetical protein MKX01_001921 [Papaver californicum]
MASTEQIGTENLRGEQYHQLLNLAQFHTGEQLTNVSNMHLAVPLIHARGNLANGMVMFDLPRASLYGRPNNLVPTYGTPQ